MAIIFWTMLLTRIVLHLLGLLAQQESTTFWSAMEAIGTWAAAFMSAGAIYVAVQAIQEARREFRAQLMPLVSLKSETVFLPRQSGLGELSFQLENQGRGPAIMIDAAGKFGLHMYHGTLVSLGPHKDDDMVLRPLFQTSETSPWKDVEGGQVDIEYRDSLGRNYTTVVHFCMDGASLVVDNVSLKYPDFRI